MIFFAAPKYLAAEKLALNMNESSKVSSKQYTSEKFKVSDNLTVSITYFNKYDKILPEIRNTIRSFHGKFKEIIGAGNNLHVNITILPYNQFHIITGAPSWTNALFYDGQIFLPVKESEDDFAESLRPLKHELTHAILKDLSGGRCPGWLDEGIAQWAEGEEIDGLRNALAFWYIDNKRLISPEILKGGFTGLESNEVAPAYAQSLLAAKLLFKAYGVENVKRYLTSLRMKEPYSFERNFNTTHEDFWKLLEDALIKEKIISTD